jgi:hypothetical protein
MARSSPLLYLPKLGDLAEAMGQTLESVPIVVLTILLI